MQTHHFPDITLLVTHYNRSASLQNMLQSFRVRQLSFGGIVVSDDGSQPLHFDKLQELQKEFGFTLVPAVKNGGLGKNLNKGQDAVKLPTLCMCRKILRLQINSRVLLQQPISSCRKIKL
ncbi:glycosyltransferase [Niabella defluvii]|nr:glycosyltransferase [Niabella sp. I65]